MDRRGAQVLLYFYPLNSNGPNVQLFCVMQVVFTGVGQVWERGLEEHFKKLCDFKNSNAGGKPCPEILHPFELHEQGQEEVQHPRYHQRQRRGGSIVGPPGAARNRPTPPSPTSRSACNEASSEAKHAWIRHVRWNASGAASGCSSRPSNGICSRHSRNDANRASPPHPPTPSPPPTLCSSGRLSHAASSTTTHELMAKKN